MLDVIAGFGALRSDSGRRAVLRYLRLVAASPSSIGWHPEVNYCGCDRGFRERSGSTFTVEICPVHR